MPRSAGSCLPVTISAAHVRVSICFNENNKRNPIRDEHGPEFDKDRK